MSEDLNFVRNRGRAALQGRVKLEINLGFSPCGLLLPQAAPFSGPFHLCRCKQQRTRALTLRARGPFVMLIT